MPPELHHKQFSRKRRDAVSFAASVFVDEERSFGTELFSPYRIGWTALLKSKMISFSCQYGRLQTTTFVTINNGFSYDCAKVIQHF